MTQDGHYDAPAHHRTQTSVLKPGDVVRNLTADEVARLRSMGVIEADEPIEDTRNPHSIALDQKKQRIEQERIAQLIARGGKK